MPGSPQDEQNPDLPVFTDPPPTSGTGAGPPTDPNKPYDPYNPDDLGAGGGGTPGGGVAPAPPGTILPPPPPGGVITPPLGGVVPPAAAGGLDELLKKLLSPEGMASLAPLLIALMRGSGSTGAANLPETAEARRMNQITEARMRRVDPLHEAVAQLAYSRLPTNMQNGPLPRVTLPPLE